MKINATEKRWLHWARKIIRTDGVQNRCRVCTHDRTNAFERVLWPGYIGKSYRPGGMLLVGAVHNREEFETRPIVQLAAFAEKWARDAGTCLDEQYLENLREAYINSATQRISKSGKAWTDGAVWNAFDTLRRDAGLQWSDIAFTNWSKCASPTQPIKTIRDRLYQGHIWEDVPILDRLPIKELRPSAVFVLCGDAKVVRALRSATLGIPIVRAFAQRGYVSKFPDGRRWHEWRANDIARFKQHPKT